MQRPPAGDRAAALFVGLPPERFLGKPLGPVDPDIQEFARPLAERAGLVSAINEAWAMMALAVVLALIGILVAGNRSAAELSPSRQLRFVAICRARDMAALHALPISMVPTRFDIHADSGRTAADQSDVSWRST